MHAAQIDHGRAIVSIFLVLIARKEWECEHETSTICEPVLLAETGGPI